MLRVLMFATCMMNSSRMLKKLHDNASPCRKPLIVVNVFEIDPLILTQLLITKGVIRHRLMSLVGMPKRFIALNSSSLVGVSYACLKSMNRWWVSTWNSWVFSRICRCVKIWSVVDFPGMKPHWYGPMIRMTCGFNLSHRIDAGIL